MIQITVTCRVSNSSIGRRLCVVCWAESFRFHTLDQLKYVCCWQPKTLSFWRNPNQCSIAAPIQPFCRNIIYVRTIRTCLFFIARLRKLLGRQKSHKIRTNHRTWPDMNFWAIGNPILWNNPEPPPIREIARLKLQICPVFLVQVTFRHNPLCTWMINTYYDLGGRIYNVNVMRSL